MLALCLLFALAAPAHADLYRWIDPATGTVKLSSLPPSDASIEPEIVRYNAPPPSKLPAVAPIVPAASATGGTVPDLEARWHSILTQLTGLTPQDFKQGSDGLRQHIQAFESVRAELDRLDPAGVARRNAETTALVERLKQGITASR